MDERLYFILRDPASNEQEDITADTASIEIIKDRVFIQFNNNSSLKYNFRRKRILYDDKPQKIDSDIEFDEQIFLDVQEIIRFGNYVKIFYQSGKTQYFPINKIKMRSDAQIITCFKYFKRIADELKPFSVTDNRFEEQSEINLISSQYEEIENISKNSVLFYYLSGILPEQNNSCKDLIFPFSCNLSQVEALEKALSNRISIIEGPPGTGKTQTILNIIANIVANGQDVAIVSNNNSAIANVYEKLFFEEEDGQQINLQFIAALLGKKANKDNFLMNGQLDYPDWKESGSSWAAQNQYELKIKVRELIQELKELFKSKNTLAELKMSLDKLLHEERLFNNRFSDLPDLPYRGKNLSLERIFRLLIGCNQFFDQEKQPSLWFKIKKIVFSRIGSFNFFQNKPSIIILALKRLIYRKKVLEISHEISSLEKYLKESFFEGKFMELTTYSRRLLKNSLYAKYSGKKRPSFSAVTELEKDSFRNEYPIVLSTTYMIKKCIQKGKMFDFLIMDEASQVDLCTGVLALSCAKHIVIVGDCKQLPCVVTNKELDKLKNVHSEMKIPEVFQYTIGQSLLSSVSKVLPAVPRTLLREHYRCHPKIIDFCNQRFYDGQLIIMTNSEDTSPMHIVETVPGDHARNHVNQRQCDEADVITSTLYERGYSEESIGYIAPYRDQAEKLGGSTVHKYQGREKDVIVISTVDNQISTFTSDENLVNVAVSRARKELYLLISSSNQNFNNCIGDLTRYIRYYNGKDAVIRGEITSVFDLLYSMYAKQRDEFLKRRNKVSEYDSENLMFGLICDIIYDKQYQNRFRLMDHVPLMEIFRDSVSFPEREKEYLFNENTHVDFLIYEKFGMQPVLGIEVDGYNYHRPGSRQNIRDQMKNNIFLVNNITLLRFSTMGSREADQIKQHLTNLMA